MIMSYVYNKEPILNLGSKWWQKIVFSPGIIRSVMVIPLFFILTLPLIAGTTGKIKGKITDKNTEEPIFGANIVIEGTYFGAAADDEGDYYINNIPPGRYNLIISAIGYNKVRVENVLVKIDLTTNVDMELISTI